MRYWWIKDRIKQRQFKLVFVTLNEISGQQSTATTDTETKCTKLMDYLHTHPDAVI